jgi:DNA mismatch repair protein MutL
VLHHPEELQSELTLDAASHERASRHSPPDGRADRATLAVGAPKPGPGQEKSGPGPRPEDFRVLGVIGRLYVVMENASGLVLVDQHAAHERILFEQLRARLEQQDVPAQRLLLPLTIEVNPRDHDWLRMNQPTLQRLGVGIEAFGHGTFKIDALPQFVKVEDPQAFLWQLIDELRDASKNTSSLRLGEEMIAKTVCRHAVKANDDLSREEIHALLRDLLACDLPYCCPHGRPTMIQMSFSELEKKFGRIV